MVTPSAEVLKPGRKDYVALDIGCDDLPVRPLGLQGAVEPFDLAVLPGAVRADEDVPSTSRSDDLANVVSVLVGEVVVGRHPFDPMDALLGEVPLGAADEPGAGGGLLVRHDLAVGQQ